MTSYDNVNLLHVMTKPTLFSKMAMELPTDTEDREFQKVFYESPLYISQWTEKKIDRDRMIYSSSKRLYFAYHAPCSQLPNELDGCVFYQSSIWNRVDETTNLLLFGLLLIRFHKDIKQSLITIITIPTHISSLNGIVYYCISR